MDDDDVYGKLIAIISVVDKMVGRKAAETFIVVNFFSFLLSANSNHTYTFLLRHLGVGTLSFTADFFLTFPLLLPNSVLFVGTVVTIQK